MLDQYNETKLLKQNAGTNSGGAYIPGQLVSGADAPGHERENMSVSERQRMPTSDGPTVSGLFGTCLAISELKYSSPKW